MTIASNSNNKNQKNLENKNRKNKWGKQFIDCWLVQKEYMNRYDWVGKVTHLGIAQDIKIWP